LDAESAHRPAALVNCPTAVTFHIVPPSAKLARPADFTSASHHIDVIEVFAARVRS
jgi:hypothetical protein